MRRLVDVVVASIGFVVLSPILVVAALSILLGLGRPVLFRQERSGLASETFNIVKFRTMAKPRYEDEPDEARINWLGNVLRVTSIDELPQMWNILRGEMSLIGPRPTLPSQVVHYSSRQRGRLAVRPGLTGWAQVRGRNSLSWPERIELDLWYIDHRSWRVDGTIILLTIVCLLRPRGVVGVGGVNPDFPVPTPPLPLDEP
ncbi:sugar transferase [Actinomycetospora sp. C-140]